MRHPLTVHERPAAGPVEAVIFDWGGTLTPWHTIDLGQQWRVFAREVHGIPIESDEVPQADLDRAQELAERIHAVEAHAWRQVRDEQRGAHLDDILAEAGIDPREDRHHVALAAYRRFWEPHTHTDPQVRPLWEGLRARGLKVGVLSNTIWSGDYHREIFERDGVLDLIDGDVYSSEIQVVKPHREAFEAAAAAVGVHRHTMRKRIETAEDVWDRITHGANLVQTYTGFIFTGPSLVRGTNRLVARRLRQGGFGSLAEAVGSAVR